jgi:hypothetical protein
LAKDLRKHLKPGAQGRGYGANPGGGGGGHKKKGCCSMVAAVQAVRRGKFRLARRYAVKSVRLITARLV